MALPPPSPYSNFNPRQFQGTWRVSPDFNKDIAKIDPYAPLYQQQIGVYDAARRDISERAFGSSDFYDARNYLTLTTAVTENLRPKDTGLMDQLIPNFIFNSDFSNMDYLNKPMEMFNKIMTTPNYGEGFQVPMKWVNTVEGGPVIPEITNTDESAQYMGFSSMGPLFTPIGAIPPTGVAGTQYGTPEWAGLPIVAQSGWMPIGWGSLQSQVPFSRLNVQLGYDPRYLSQGPTFP